MDSVAEEALASSAEKLLVGSVIGPSKWYLLGRSCGRLRGNCCRSANAWL